MEDTFKRLLRVEAQAQATVEAASKESEQIIEQARESARNAERGFGKRVAEIQSTLMHKSQERAEQTIAEMERRYHERRDQLQLVVKKTQADAIEAALDFFVKHMSQR